MTQLTCIEHVTLNCPVCTAADKQGYNNRWFGGGAPKPVTLSDEAARLTEENEKLRGMIVQKLDLKKGDILVISTDPPMSPEEANRVRSQLTEVCGGRVSVVCISPCVSAVTVLRPPQVHLAEETAKEVIRDINTTDPRPLNGNQTIVVNCVEQKWPFDRISYKNIVALATEGCPGNEIYSVTFRTKTLSGTMHPGSGYIMVEQGMVFNAVVTNNG